LRPSLGRHFRPGSGSDGAPELRAASAALAAAYLHIFAGSPSLIELVLGAQKWRQQEGDGDGHSEMSNEHWKR